MSVELNLERGACAHCSSCAGTGRLVGIGNRDIECPCKGCSLCEYYAKPVECDCHPEKREPSYCCCRAARSLMRWKDHQVADAIVDGVIGMAVR